LTPFSNQPFLTSDYYLRTKTVKEFAMSSSNSIQELGLSETIQKVKEELVKSQTKSTENSSEPMFRVKNVSVEVKFTIRETENTSGSIDLKLVAIKMGDDITSERIHSVKIDLEGLEGVDFGLLQDRRE